MGKKINNPSYDVIAKALTLCKESEKRSRWSAVSFSNNEPLFAAFNSLSRRQKIKAVKDSRWNHYPITSYSSRSKKRYGSALFDLVKTLVVKGGEDADILINHSSGVIAIMTMDSECAKNRLRMAKRLKFSPDYRLRTRAVKALPHKTLKRHLHRFLGDKHYSVSTMAVSRLGMDNCYELLIPSTLDRKTWDWNAYQAVELATYDEVKHLIPDGEETFESTYFIERVLSMVFEKMPAEEMIYHLDSPFLASRTFNRKTR